MLSQELFQHHKILHEITHNPVKERRKLDDEQARQEQLRRQIERERPTVFKFTNLVLVSIQSYLKIIKQVPFYFEQITKFRITIKV